MKYTVIILLALSNFCSAQNQPDSISASINIVNDSTYTVETEVYFFGQNGEQTASTVTSRYLDSAEVADYILSVDYEGLNVNGVEVIGKKRTATLAQKFIAAYNSASTIYSDLYELHTGIGSDMVDRGLDYLFVGNWQWRQSGDPARVNFNVLRRPNGRLVALTDDGGSLMIIASRNGVAIRNFGGSTTGTVDFYRRPGTDTFESVGRDNTFFIRKLND
jgi:hypothetical protein